MGLQREVETPNITGYHNQLLTWEHPTPTGVFSQSSQETAFLDSSAGNKVSASVLAFYASSSQSIYSGSTLQPKALQTLACIRI